VRGEFSIYISLPGPHRRWDSLDSALLWINMQQGIQIRSHLPSWGYGADWNSLDWNSIDHFLVDTWDRLKAAADAHPYLKH